MVCVINHSDQDNQPSSVFDQNDEEISKVSRFKAMCDRVHGWDWCQDDVRLLLFCLFGGREVTQSSNRTVCTESRTVRILIRILKSQFVS